MPSNAGLKNNPKFWSVFPWRYGEFAVEFLQSEKSL